MGNLLNLGLGRGDRPRSPDGKSQSWKIPIGRSGGSSLPILFALLTSAVLAQEKPSTERIAWQFPTENRYLAEEKPEKFFQPTISRRLKSGMFGFVRTSDPEPARIFERFHKGIDIKPLRRDAQGEPLDVVRAIADGLVVRVNEEEKISDYGKQVIVRHLWGEQPVYSIYGHLASTAVKVGQAVKTGDPLGVMGWTGPGLDRSRAHLHLEITFQINPRFEEWVKTAKPGRLWEPNRHGEWNGLNLMGIDPAPLLLAARQEKPKTWREALAGQPGGFVVRVAAPKARVNWTDWVQVQENCTGQETWEIEMTPWGLPLRVSASAVPSNGPELVANPGRPNEGKYYCRGLVEADGKGGMRLSKFGRQYLEMMMFTGSASSAR